MEESELLDELSKNLSSYAHREYVDAYTCGKVKGLSEKFDEIVKEELNEA